MPKLKINAPDGKIIRIDVPEGSTPDQYDSIVDDVLSDYESSQVETPGMLESGARGLMSGIPGATTAVSGIQALGDKTYEQTRKTNEIASDKAWEEHPVAYGAGKTAGMVGTAVALPASIPAAAGVGAAAGLDAATKIEDMPMDALKGAGMGGAFGAAGKYVAEPLIGAAVNKLAPAVGKRAVASLGKPTLQDVESYLKNPEAIRNALTNPQMAEKLAGSAEDVGKVSGQLASGAREMLDENRGVISLMDVKPIIMGAKQKYLTNGLPASAADEVAIKALDGQYERMYAIAKALRIASGFFK